MTRRRIVVSHHCQAPGIALALSALLPDDEVIPYPFFVPHDAARVKDFTATLDQADVWVAMIGHEFLSSHPSIAGALRGKPIILVPMVEFHAFHPDMTYLTDRRNRMVLKPPYNSRIIFWCWREGIEQERVPALFSEVTFERLGYFSAWGRAETYMRTSFANCGLDFGRFFLEVKRLGAFMHTLNHPSVEVLNALTKQVALKLGAPETVRATTLRLPDLIDSEKWPVYPAIGRRLSLPGCYVWRTEGRTLSLRDYIRFAYETYDRNALPREFVDFHNTLGGPDTQEMGVILQEQLERTVR